MQCARNASDRNRFPPPHLPPTADPSSLPFPSDRSRFAPRPESTPSPIQVAAIASPPSSPPPPLPSSSDCHRYLPRSSSSSSFPERSPSLPRPLFLILPRAIAIAPLLHIFFPSPSSAAQSTRRVRQRMHAAPLQHPPANYRRPGAAPQAPWPHQAAQAPRESARAATRSPDQAFFVCVATHFLAAAIALSLLPP